MTIPVDDASPPTLELGDEVPVALYRLFSPAELLYVGITDNLKVRFRQHRAKKAWWPEVTRKTVEWYPTRAEARAAELTAIRTEDPRHNVEGVPAAGLVLSEVRWDTSLRIIATVLDHGNPVRCGDSADGWWCECCPETRLIQPRTMHCCPHLLALREGPYMEPQAPQGELVAA